MAREPAPRTPDDLNDEEDETDAAQVFALRQTYWRNGYRPVPVYSRQKRPRGNGWLADALQDPPLWATRWPEIVALSTGLATGPLAGFDVDVLIQAVVDRIVWETEQMLGTTPLVRIGRAPKTLLGFRCEHDPFRKLSTGTFIMPDGTEAKVEMLADGQQFVADGIHPDTGQPYLWPAGSPETVPLANVPPITFEQAQALVAKARELIIANGGVEKKPPPPRQQQSTAAGADSFFAAVNAAALGNLAAWVRTLFPRATYQLGTGAWRVASKDRGRPDLEEDISLHPGGIQDFGCEQGLSPIDAVIQFGGAADAVAAAHWLCERLGIQPAALGWEQRDTPRPSQPHPSPAPDDETNYWPEPVDILADSDTGAPILTADHVPPSLWPFIHDTAERMGVATSSVALAAVVSCSAVISEEWHIQPKQNDYLWTEQARLWGAIVGPPSIMKSPVIKAATEPVAKLDRDARKTWADAIAVYKVSLKAWKALKDTTEPEPQPPRKARHIVESVTIEALQEVLRDDPDGRMTAPLGKVLCRQDELSGFLAGMDRYSTGGKGGTAEQAAWLQTYNGGDYTVDRIGRGSFSAASWSVCVLGGIQPEPIQRIATRADQDGMLQRFMYDVPAPQSGGLDRAPDYPAIVAYRDLFPALAALRPARTGDAHNRHEVVVLHRDVHPVREDINTLAVVMANMPNASKQLQSALGKWPGTFARLCLTYHLIEIAAARVRGDIGPPPGVVSAQTAARVRRYMRAVLAPNTLRADAIMFSSRQSEHAAWIASYILAGKLAVITAREIAKDYRALKAPEQRDTLDSTMDSLCRLCWLEADVPANPVKPPTRWRVNPNVHIRFAARAEAERKRRDAVREAIAAHVASLGNADNAA